MKKNALHPFWNLAIILLLWTQGLAVAAGVSDGSTLSTPMSPSMTSSVSSSTDSKSSATTTESPTSPSTTTTTTSTPPTTQRTTLSTTTTTTTPSTTTTTTPSTTTISSTTKLSTESSTSETTKRTSPGVTDTTKSPAISASGTTGDTSTTVSGTTVGTMDTTTTPTTEPTFSPTKRRCMTSDDCGTGAACLFQRCLCLLGYDFNGTICVEIPTTIAQTFSTSTPDASAYTYTSTEAEMSTTEATEPTTSSTSTTSTTTTTTTTSQRPTTTRRKNVNVKPKDDGSVTTMVVALVGVGLFVGVIVVVAAFLWRFKRVDNLPIQLSMKSKFDQSKIPREQPIRLADIESRVAELHGDSNRLFSMQYEDIVRISPKHPTSAANIDENKQKNRWVNVLPYDDTRVRLDPIDNDATTDYINASYVPGYNWNKEYVATQGPLPGTVDDFWRMIWELNVSMIVMVTPLKENGKVKCEEYWPVEVQEPKEYGDIVVENISFSSLNTYNVSIFQLRRGTSDEFRTVKHFHFLNWKDMSADVERADILNFVRTVRSYLRPNMEGPIVIHCSAGVGRTGTFISIDYLIQFIENHDLDESVDIYSFVLKMRENRVLMVQTESQYVFIHDCAVQLVDEKRLMLDARSEDELLYVNQEMCPINLEDVSLDDELGLNCENGENNSTSRLLQQTEL